jgi:hypothetical protein
MRIRFENIRYFTLNNLPYLEHGDICIVGVNCCDTVAIFAYFVTKVPGGGHYCLGDSGFLIHCTFCSLLCCFL